MYMYAHWIVCYPEGAGGGGPYLSVALYVDTCAFVMGRIFMNGLINVRRRQSPTVAALLCCFNPSSLSSAHIHNFFPSPYPPPMRIAAVALAFDSAPSPFNY